MAAIVWIVAVAPPPLRDAGVLPYIVDFVTECRENALFLAEKLIGKYGPRDGPKITEVEEDPYSKFKQWTLRNGYKVFIDSRELM